MLARRLLPEFRQLLEKEKIPQGDEILSCFYDCYLPFAGWLADCHKDKPLVIGVNGAQGSGKSTLTHILATLLEKGHDKRIVSLSIDDLYKTRQQRQEMADSIHPLLATRGVPGTHDVDMGLELFASLKGDQSAQELSVPRFNKAIDDRHDKADWDKVCTPVDIIIFEGWCVGSIAEDDESLDRPINNLEADEDTQGFWRQFINNQLSGPYQQLFSHIDILVMLDIPDMEYVYKWRSLQEEKLRTSVAGEDVDNSHHIMSAENLDRFIMHYERITRANLREMPSRADIVLKLNADHQISKVVSGL